jgi:hypothetical protein
MYTFIDIHIHVYIYVYIYVYMLYICIYIFMHAFGYPDEQIADAGPAAHTRACAVCVCDRARTHPRRHVQAPSVGVDRGWLGSQAFYSASAFNANIGAWNTARVTSLNYVCAAVSARRRATAGGTRSAGRRCGAGRCAPRRRRCACNIVDLFYICNNCRMLSVSLVRPRIYAETCEPFPSAWTLRGSARRCSTLRRRSTEILRRGTWSASPP